MFSSASYFQDFWYEWPEWVYVTILVGGLAHVFISIGGLLALAVLVLVPWRRGGAPRCGHCGYQARGLDGLQCPECGADFRDVGILAPGQRRRLHPLISIPLWSFFLVAPAAGISMVALALGPQVGTYTHNIDITPLVPVDGYNQIQLYAYTETSAPQPSAQTLDIDIHQENDYRSFVCDLSAMTYTEAYSNTGLPTPAALNRAAIDEMFKRSGADITKPALRQQADEVWAIVREAPTQGLRKLETAGPRHFSVAYNETWLDGSPAPWFGMTVLLIWIVIWSLGVLGLIILDLRRRTPLANSTPRRPERSPVLY